MYFVFFGNPYKDSSIGPELAPPPPCSALKGSKPKGHLIFENYIPSKLETIWTDNIGEWAFEKSEQFCDRVREYKKEVYLSTKLSSASQKGCGYHDKKLLEHSDIFSRYKYKNSETGEIVYYSIEPLAFFLRDPRAECIEKTTRALLSRDYLVLGLTDHKRCTGAPPPMFLPDRKVFLFDLGASLYNKGAGGPSQSWFWNALVKHGVDWQSFEYYGWEAATVDAAELFKPIPRELKFKYHYFNIHSNPSPDSSDNPWNFIKNLVKPEDYVMVKLDIDNSVVEDAFVKQLVDDRHLSSLIDEMFYEHHVWFDIMNVYWFSPENIKKEGYPVYRLNDSYATFRELRDRGIRFHGWP